jgi:N-acetylglucosaminyldiphosphoundecaprenol N-acetyl-beta-D-mannosaminyltransferase
MIAATKHIAATKREAHGMESLLAAFPTRRLMGLDLVDASLDEVAESLATRPADARFSYIVTPNADHFVRLARQPAALSHCYSAAGAMLLDSRVVHRIACLLGLNAPRVITGSDLTEALFRSSIVIDEPVTLIGTTPAAGSRLRQTFGLSRLAHFAPPFGFESDPGMVDRCARFVRDNPSRFVFLACGSPRQELLANHILQGGEATGVGLCIGSAVDQIGGLDRRAPIWLRRGGLEWLWRILRDPAGLGPRYLRDAAIIPALIAERMYVEGSRGRH